MAQLTADEVAHYRREGWVVPGFALPPQRVAGLRDALEQLLRDNPGVRPEDAPAGHQHLGAPPHRSAPRAQSPR